MKNIIIKNLKNKFGQDARITLTLIGVAIYPLYKISCPEYLAEVLYENDGRDCFYEMVVDTIQSKFDLEASPVEYRDADYFEGCFEDEELPF